MEEPTRGPNGDWMVTVPSQQDVDWARVLVLDLRALPGANIPDVWIEATESDKPKRCGQCGKRAWYVAKIDRFIHDDGSDNRECWTDYSRGKSARLAAARAPTPVTVPGETGLRLAQWITERFHALGRPVSAADVVAQFTDQKPNTVQQNLRRLVKASVLVCPSHGLYVPATGSP